MAWNITGLGVFTTLISVFALLWSGVRHSVTAVVPKIATVSAGVVHSTSAALGSLAVGACLRVNYYTITPRLEIKIAVLTVWAYLSGRSFVVRRPGRRPHLIARHGCKHAYVFDLDDNDINAAYTMTGTHPRARLTRSWRPISEVNNILAFSTMFTPPVPIIDLNLTSYQLIGQRWTQGYGIVSRDFCAVLVDELGRYPGKSGSIAGKVFLWREGRMVFTNIPIRFVTVPGVEETLEEADVRITLEWQDLESGMSNGPKVKAFPPEWLDSSHENSPVFTIPEINVAHSCFEL